MSPSRREFIRSMGVAIASLVMARCVPFTVQSDSARYRLRDCWLRLDWLAQQTQESYEKGNQARKQLAADHRAALDELVAADRLSATVADQVQAAFSAAAEHVWISHQPVVTCYEAVVPIETPTPLPGDEAVRRRLAGYIAGCAGRLAQQAELLTEMAESSDLDHDTVARAQLAMQRDLALLTLPREKAQALREDMLQAAGDTYEFPSLAELALEIPPEAIEAARFLVELLLEE